MKKYAPEFIRFGDLRQQIHEPYGEGYSYHTAPVRKGIYAFPRGFMEGFLIGGIGLGSLQNGRYCRFRDKEGNQVMMNEEEFIEYKKNKKNLYLNKLDYIDWIEENYKEGDSEEDLDERYNKYLKEKHEVWIENKPIHFTYRGLIWHHLNVPKKLKDKVLKEVGTWILMDMSSYLKCLKAQIGLDKWRMTYKAYWNPVYDAKTNRRIVKNSPGFNYGGIPYPYSRDHFEVYIEDIQKEKKSRT